MASELSPIGNIGKWIVIPAALASTGFFLIGPRLQKRIPDLKNQTPPAVQSSRPVPPDSLASKQQVPSQTAHLARAPLTKDNNNISATDPANQGGPEVIIKEKPASGGRERIVYRSAGARRRTFLKSKKAPKKKIHIKTEVKVLPGDSGSVGGLDSPTAPPVGSGSNPGG